MPLLSITNRTSAPLFLRDLYIKIDAGKTVSGIYRSWSDISRMRGLLTEQELGHVKVQATLTSEESNNPLLTPETPQITTQYINLSVSPMPDKLFYVRTTGNDTTGDGSITKPFRTFVEAAKKLAFAWRLGKFGIDITGIDEVLPEAYQIPSLVNFDTETIDIGDPFGFIFKGPVYITATPTVLDDVQIANITETSTANNSGHITYTTNKTWTSNQFKGKYIIDSAGAIGTIASNTTNEIRVVLPTIIPPFTIYDQGATLRASVSGFSPIISVSGSCQSVTFNSIKFISGAGAIAIQTAGVRTNIVGCCLDGSVFMDKYLNLNASALIGSGLIIFSSNGVFSAFRSYIEGVGTFIPTSETNEHSLNQCIVKSCGSFPGSFFHASGRYSSINLTTFEDSTADAVSLLSTATLEGTGILITNAAGDAVRAEGTNTQLYLSSVGGTGSTGAGLRVLDGAHAVVDNTVTVAGTTELNVGTLVARTWANFRGSAPIKNQIDLTAGTGDASRVSQP